jgi:phospho-N-acetylmuramoyl-pentapeptide-transferase
MLYYLLDLMYREFHPSGLGVVRYITFRAAAAAVTALVISFWIGPKIIKKLREKQIGEAAKVEAPRTHLSKAGTPTMGGLIVLASVLIPMLLWGNLGNLYVVLIIFVTAALGAVGFLDDYLKVLRKKPKGLIGRTRLQDR